MGRDSDDGEEQMTAQQETDRRRAHAASVAMQAKAKQKNAAHDAQKERLRFLDKFRIQEQQREKQAIK